MEVLAFFAHPDDETILAGGILALLALSGGRVHYLSATRGEGGEVGEPPLCSEKALGGVRAKELACAVRALGGASLSFLDYEDPRTGPQEELYAFTEDLAGLTAALLWRMRQHAFVALITHGSNGEYGHPAHQVVNRAARAAVENMGVEAPLMYTVSPSFPQHPRPRLANADDPAHLVVDIHAVIERKVQAALCHRTQNALFVRRASQEAGRPMTVEEVVGQYAFEGLHRAHPQTAGLPQDPIAQALAGSTI